MHSAAATRAELRNFGLVLGAMFAGFFGLIPLAIHHRTRIWPWTVAAVLWTTALTLPSALRIIHLGWCRLGLWLGWFNTRVILTLVFGLMIAPLGVVLRFFGRDRVGRRFEPHSKSYRTSSRERPSCTMENPY
jgi:hypothetical protein